MGGQKVNQVSLAYCIQMNLVWGIQTKLARALGLRNLVVVIVVYH